jgi:DNA polymerase-3 subunit gamma/tau
MDYQVSARKYRPSAFDEVIGQPHVVQMLQNALTTKRLAHAFLFSGTRGVGKTTVARILAKALNCEQGPTSHPCDQCPSCADIASGTSVDVVEIDGASNTSVDDVREIRDNVKFAPFRGGYRVYIIDEVHMLSNSAFNALLKTLEEPPPHVVFIFATTELHKIPATILSRCQHYNFKRIQRAEVIRRLRHVADQEQLVIEDRSLGLLGRAADGSMRDALSLLDQAAAFGGKTVTHADLEALLGAVPQELVRAAVRAMQAQDAGETVRLVSRLLSEGHDLKVFCGDLVEYVRNLLVASVVTGDQELAGLIEASEDDIRQMGEDAKGFAGERLQEIFRLLTQTQDALRTTAHTRFTFEVALIRAARLGTVAADSQPPARPLSAQAAPVARPTPPSSGTPPAPVKAVAAAAISSDIRPTTRPAPEKASTPLPPARSASAAPPPPTQAVGTAGKPAPAQPAERPSPVREAAVATAPPLQLDWDHILERVEHLHPSIAPFLAAGRLVSTQGEQVTIGYPRSASVALTRVQRAETLTLIAEVCSALAGRPVKLGVVEVSDGQVPGPSMAEIRAAREQDHKRQLLERAKAHPLVTQALGMFGGELVDVRVNTPEKESPS